MADVTEPKARTERDTRRIKSDQAAADLSTAKAALIKAEIDVKACDDSIDTHRAALVSHKRALKSSADERKGLVAARKHARSELIAATATAAKADAKYDKAVLAQIVRDAKDTEHTAAAKKTAPAKRPYARRTPAAAKVSTARSAPRKAAAAAPAKTTTPRTPRAGNADPAP